MDRRSSSRTIFRSFHFHRLLAILVLSTVVVFSVAPTTFGQSSGKKDLQADRVRASQPLPTAKLQQTQAKYVMRAAAQLPGGDQNDVAVEDVDNDGNLDVLIPGENTGRSSSSALYYGDGNGSFTKAPLNLVNVRYGSATIANLDNEDPKELIISGSSPNAGGIAGGVTRVYMNDGSGFQETTPLPSDKFYTILARDLVGDDNLDLFLVGGRDVNSDYAARLYEGHGDGTFTEVQDIGITETEKGDAAIADVNRDGHQDILIAGSAVENRGGGQYRSIEVTELYYGDGAGNFSKANANLPGMWGSSVAVADVAGDDHLDLLLTGNHDDNQEFAALYVGDQNGSFTKANAGLTGSWYGSASIADVVGSDAKDLLLTGNGMATLYENEGSKTFNSVDAGLSGVYASSAEIADFGGDGDPDLFVNGAHPVVGNATKVYVHRTNQSPPNQAPRFDHRFGDQVMAPGLTLNKIIEAGDPDGDRLSMSLAQGGANRTIDHAGNGVGKVTFTPQRSDGGTTVNLTVEATETAASARSASYPVSVEVPPYVAAVSNPFPGREQAAVATADVDGQHGADVLLTGDGSSDPAADLYLRQSDGSFSKASSSSTIDGVQNGDAVFADILGTSHLDLLVAGSGSATLYEGDGTGSFTESSVSSTLTGVDYSAVAVGDVDDDSRTDLLITGNDGSDPSTTLYLQESAGSFSAASVSLQGVEHGAVTIADITGTNDPDLLVTGEGPNFDSKHALVYEGDGTGSFSEAPSVSSTLTGVNRSTVETDDVDDQHGVDLLVAGDDGSGGSATLYLQESDGSFSKASAGLFGTENGSASIADVTGNGHSDILLTGDNSAALYEGDGTGAFAKRTLGLAGVNWSASSIVDLVGDDELDLLVAGDGTTYLYENLFANPLPVELASFDAATENGQIHLSWTTASETNNAGFEVQRRASEDSGWATLGFVDGSGTTSSPQTYRFTDADLPYDAEAATYRLRQVDTDGTTHLSKTVTVERGAPEALRLLKTTPNPARQQATVRYAVPQRRSVTLRLYDVLGRSVRTVRPGPKKGRRELQLDVSDLSSGTYFLRLQAGAETETRQLTVVQ